MSAAALAAVPGAVEERPQYQIPIKNLWFLLLYAANLADFLGRFDSEADGAADIADLLGLLLAHLVEQRLRRISRESTCRNRGYLHGCEDVLMRDKRGLGNTFTGERYSAGLMS
jgi:hypothetical protein